MYNLSDYHYELPQELIAQEPSQERDNCRLMVVEKRTGKIWEMPFHELVDYLGDGDRLILNNTKVIPARLLGHRSNGCPAEIFLVKNHCGTTWEVMAKPGKKIKVGSTVFFGEGITCKVEEDLASGHKIVTFDCSSDEFEKILYRIGIMPLPHYIRRDKGQVRDFDNYQTVFAEKSGAVAAPTAGLHFTPEMLSSLGAKGVPSLKLTLHVGIGTFKPVVVDDIRDHKMHFEEYEIDKETARILNSPARSICVGTTCCRALESAADEKGVIIPQRSDTNIFIYPGYKFRYVQNMITNFHLPSSTLMMLVSALAGKELIFEAYRKAVEKRFRFFSYGDAMLIVD